jgi:glycolate oxidase iron-sulfur subunit
MRRNIDAWWPYLDDGVEKIVMTASGCGVTVREYGHLLRNDSHYAEKAARVSELTLDLSELLAAEDLTPLGIEGGGTKVAFHPPCTLQHGQKLTGVVEGILETLGFALTPIPEKHLCCGSSGTYSILQKSLSQQLLKDKVEALESGSPDIIASANIGCQLHLQSGMDSPVRHWIELLDTR